MSLINVSLHITPTWIGRVEVDGIAGLDRDAAGVVRIHDHHHGCVSIHTSSVASARALARAINDALSEATGRMNAEKSAA